MSIKPRQGELKEDPKINNQLLTKNQKPYPSSLLDMKTDVGNLDASYVKKTEENSEGAAITSDINQLATSNYKEEDEENYFSLWHKNHHGSIDLGLDEKVN